jgi:hypothetical protein
MFIFVMIGGGKLNDFAGIHDVEWIERLFD